MSARDDMGLKAGYAGLLDIVMDTQNLMVMYYLAKHNPKIHSAEISDGLLIGREKVKEILSVLQNNQLVIYEADQGYTLTPKGLACVYNVHVTATSK